MKNALTLEFLETRTLLAGERDNDCQSDAQDPFHRDEGSRDAEGGSCMWENEGDPQPGGAEADESERVMLDWGQYALARIGVTAVSAGMGILEGGIVGIPSAVLIFGGKYLLDKASFSMPDSLELASSILVGLATYSLSLNVMDELLTTGESTDPLMTVLYPVKAWVQFSDSVIEYFESIESLEVHAWAEALQPHSIKNAYWAAAATVFSGASGGFDYPHLELPERPEHRDADTTTTVCMCEC